MKRKFKFVNQSTIFLLHLCFFLSIGSMDLCAQSQGDVLIENDALLVRISSKGAELQNIIHKKTQTEYLWQGDPTYWKDRSPVMFPVNVRFKDNQFSYKGRLYDMPQMGLAIEAGFRSLNVSETNRCRLELQSDEQSLLHYPFPFRLEVNYVLEENTVVNQFTIENTGKEIMYFALGGHPGFRFPDQDNQERKNYQYTFSKKMKVSRIEIAESLVQKNVIPFLNNENSLSLDDTRIPANGSGMFLKQIEARRIGLGLRGEAPFVEVDLGDFPNVNLWTPPGSPYACIEPMLSHHDLVDAHLDIEEKLHLIALPAGESRTYQYTILVREYQK